MRILVTSRRVGWAVGLAAMTAGCVQPAYVAPGPIQLQPYPPAVSFRSEPEYRPPVSGPIPLQPAPLVEPLPPPIPAPTVTELPADDPTGVIPIQNMPTPTADSVGHTPDAPAVADAPAPQIVRRTPVSGPGNNVPLEGFRPMRGQTRPTP